MDIWKHSRTQELSKLFMWHGNQSQSGNCLRAASKQQHAMTSMDIASTSRELADLPAAWHQICRLFFHMA
jgi:hypothetical protein